MSINDVDISRLPSCGKWFVGITTTLMVFVTLWVVLMYTAETGSVDPAKLPAYLSDEQEARIKQRQKHSSDSNAAELSDTNGYDTVDSRIYDADGKSRWRRNLGMAHTHINGQTLLFFALGLLFLFTSVPPKHKRLAYLVFAFAIVMHAIGLSGEGFYPIFEDILAISGLTIVLMMLYMATMIYVDLGRKRNNSQ